MVIGGLHGNDGWFGFHKLRNALMARQRLDGPGLHPRVKRKANVLFAGDRAHAALLRIEGKSGVQFNQPPSIWDCSHMQA